MRFQVAHKVTTYLMMGCAYLALILSGELNPLIVGLSVVAVVGSWRCDAARMNFARYDKLWIILSLGVLAYSVLDFLTGTDVILVGAHFLLYLVLAKLYNRRASKDYQQIYLLSFLMLVAGSVLNSEVTYGLFFIGFVVTATWALILFNLRRDMEENFLLRHSEDAAERVRTERILASRRIVGKKFFLGTSFVSLSVFALASILFLAIPRIGMGFFFNKTRSNLSMTGFSDGVQLGGHGLIKTDDTVVMRVKISDKYQGSRAPYIHWRGVAFDRYVRGTWARSVFAPKTRREISIQKANSKHFLQYDDQSQWSPTKKTVEGAIRQEVYLEPNGYDVLFGAAMPRAFEFKNTFKEHARAGKNDEIRYAHGAGLKYVVYSDLEKPPEDALRAAHTTMPRGYDVYLEMPDNLSTRVGELAREITRGAENNYDKAVKVESWLREELGYTLVMEAPPVDVDPLEFFLFDRKEGHCEYFSSAMAILLRAVEVPTRNVNGFLGGEWNEYDEYIAVRAGDAHSWVEVLFPGQGWVTFDPTPSSSRDRLGRGDLGFLDKLRRFGDTLRFKWFKWVIEYDLYRQLQLFRDMGKAFRGGGGAIKRGTSNSTKWVKDNKATLGGVFLGLVLGALAWIAYRQFRHPTRGGPSGRGPRRRRGPISGLYRSTLTKFEKRGFLRPTHATPREFAGWLAEARAPGADSMGELTDLYYRAEYGGADGGDALARAKELKQMIFGDLARAPRRR